MATHRWSVICHAAETGVDNNLSLTGIVDELHLNGIPRATVEAGGGIGIKTDLHIVSVWHRDDWSLPESAQTRLVFIDPKGDTLGFTREQDVNVHDFPVVRMLAKLDFLPLHGFGIYTIRVEKRPDAEGPWVPAGGDIAIGIWEAPAQQGSQPNIATSNVG